MNDRDAQVQKLAQRLTLGDENQRYAERLYDLGVRVVDPPAPTVVASEEAARIYILSPDSRLCHHPILEEMCSYCLGSVCTGLRAAFPIMLRDNPQLAAQAGFAAELARRLAALPNAHGGAGKALREGYWLTEGEVAAVLSALTGPREGGV